MYVGIDSSHQLRYSFMVSGRFSEMTRFYDCMEKFLRRNKINSPFHWTKISRKVKETTIKDIFEEFKKGKLHFLVIHHPRPRGYEKKNFYHTLLTNQISKILENWLRNKYGSVTLEVDDDYNVGKGHNTFKFTKNILQQITFRLVGAPVKIITNHKIRATIKQNNKFILEFYGGVSNIKESRGIQIADVIGGYIISNKIKEDKQNIFFIKL